ncbi:MAG: hypothetical protein K2Q24_06815 [Chitinophagaceae bacterium]|jgi:hypothetical protein|nr:hypothetical protein [Chitinophagaceae bacterium]
MKKYLRILWYSFPVQLIFLHFRKYQLLLLFWFLLASAVCGGFMNHFGADSLFLSPEYLGHVNFFSAFIVGAAFGGFMTSWNITTFILFSSYCKFLATSSRPFLKYCINNGSIPLVFVLIYFIQLIRFNKLNELMNNIDILLIAFGLIAGIFIFIGLSFLYFFGSEKAILRNMQPMLSDPLQFMQKYKPVPVTLHHDPVIKVDSFLTGFFSFRQTRNVSHYSHVFLDMIFKRHHFAAVVGILFAFLLLVVYGLFLDNPYLQVPAAASIFIFFAILIAASGALAYWLDTWSIPVALLLLFAFNFLFRYEYIDIRNKAFGLNYEDRNKRPAYSLASMMQLCTPAQMSKDSLNMVQLLENWKRNQSEEKPLLYVINVSGGGNRSATFTVNILSKLDSLLNGALMKKTVLFSGASGGMLGAAYYRELYRKKQKGEAVDFSAASTTANISKDLLNPIFSAYVTRDLLTPAQKFSVGPYRYVKDRGYSFEQQLSYNTGNILGDRLMDYKEEEILAKIPLGLFSSTVSQDGRKLMICSQPISFLMRPQHDSARGITAEPDAIDYTAFFKDLNPYNIRLLSALRMNATFPYVLPNVWLPTKPIVDVMDAGLRDNYGQEITLRYLHVFANWIKANTSGVVFIQIRDRKKGEWNEDLKEPSIGDILYKPVTTLQYNFYKVQDYMQETMVSYSLASVPLHRFTFIYQPKENKKGAALSFHLTATEKKDIAAAVFSKDNEKVFRQLLTLQQLAENGHLAQGINKE